MRRFAWWILRSQSRAGSDLATGGPITEGVGVDGEDVSVAASSPRVDSLLLAKEGRRGKTGAATHSLSISFFSR